jgi:quercetin dioxygenase-like cupin family protein
MLKDIECRDRYEQSLDIIQQEKTPTLGQIHALQELVGSVEQTANEPIHRFADGMYVRELTINAGDVVVGKMHKHEHPVMLIKGSATVWTEKEVVRITAPQVWISQPGVKRVVMAHDECVFVTVHLNGDNGQDMDAIESFHIVPEHLEMEYKTKMLANDTQD